MPVREKGKKRKVLTNKLTIDELHKSKYNEIENIEETRREYEEEISTIKAELNLLRKNTLAPSGIPKMNIEYKIWQLEDRIEHLQSEIDDLRNKERRYLLHSSKILKNYYKMVKAEEETIKQLHEADFENNTKPKRGRKKPSITTTTVISTVKFSIFPTGWPKAYHTEN